MKKTRSLVAILLVLLLLLSGCGASAPMEQSSKAEADIYYDAPASAPLEEPMMEEMEYVTDMSTTSQTAGGEMTVEQVQTYAEKIIYSGYVSMETTEFDETVAALDRTVKEFGGFVQDSKVNGWSRDNGDGTFTIMDRSAHYVVRIPADKFEAFMAMADGIGNVTNSSRTAENVTSQYTDYEARLSSLYTQEERLLAMLEQSGDLESLIALEARLSEVRYEIESIERNLRNLDQKLSFSTVTLELQEVESVTPTVTVQRTFGQKLADSFADGWSRFVRSLQRFVLNLAEALPSLVLLAILVVAAVLIIRKLRRRVGKKIIPNKAEKQSETTEEEK